ncbi:MAG: nickel-dependent lactate racemase [Syntrophorhabdaceae bacterium]|nr:nickel-dependent lactate racemase [Syntrophorhabdaceae bacterium]
MIVHMQYGKSGLDIELDDAWDITIIKKKQMPILSDPVSALRESLYNPVGALPIDRLVAGKKTVCIVICDNTRPVPNNILLPTIVEELLRVGVHKDHIMLLIATGLHKPTEKEELKEIIGKNELLNSFKIYNHLGRVEEEHVFLGKTKDDIPVKIDRRFIQADMRIVVGLVEPHFMAGYSGGRKLIAPGIAHEDTIRHIHAPVILELLGVDNCIIEGNPLHEILVEIARMAGECYGVNTVIDEARQVSFINFGDVIEAHLKAVAYARQFMEIEINKRFPVVLTSGAGYPLDKNYYQTVKGMVAALNIIEPGGNLFIVSQCSEGMGSNEFIASQKKLCELGIKGFMDSISKKTYADIDEWETEMLVKALKTCHIFLYSTGITEKYRPFTCVKNIDDINYKLKRCMEGMKDKRLAVIPEGPYVVPVYKEIA